jgi:FMN-dependent NADH-azoreductase
LINGEGSVSNGICNSFVSAFKEKFPDSQIVERDLQSNPVPHVSFLNDAIMIFTPKF